MEQKIGLCIGRFQPFHLGHIDAIKQAKEYGVTEFLIGIWSCDKEHTAENPFTYDERKMMIDKLLKTLNIKFTIYPIPDMEKDEDRKNHITNTIPEFDMVISGNIWITNIFKGTKYPICKVKINKEIKSTSIRHLLYIGETHKLQEMLPTQVLSYLQGINAAKRIGTYFINEEIGPKISVNGIVITKDKCIVITESKHEPLGYALPGCFVNYGETTEQAIIRGMREEIGAYINIRRIVGVMSNPKRDAGGHIISIVYMADIVSGKLKAWNNTKSLKVVKLEDAKKMNLLFDHNEILEWITSINYNDKINFSTNV